MSQETAVKHTKSNRPRLLTKKEKKTQGIGKDLGKAVLNFARISSSKVRIVANLIKGKDAREAAAILKFTPKAASPILSKLLKSAVANAENNNNLSTDKLYVADVYADQGPSMKRVMPRAQGRAYKIVKRTSHITLIVKERE